jgi:hypothetical protein
MKNRVKPPKKLEVDNNPQYYDYWKDGKPKGFWQKLLCRRYLIECLGQFFAAFFIIGILGYKKKDFSFKRFFKPKTFWFWLFPSMCMSLTWGAYMRLADPNMPGWISGEWNSFGTLFNLWPYEDLVFYPGAYVLFYTILRWFNLRTRSWSDFKGPTAKATIIYLAVFCICFMGYFGHACGVSLTIMFLLPGLGMFLYVIRRVHAKRFWVYLFLMVLLEVIWDVIDVSVARWIKGFLASWRYLAHNELGERVHSIVFMAYDWAWIGESPIEITPYYAITSVYILFFGVILTDNIFYKKTCKV